MLVLVGSFNQETALVGAFSMIVETNVSIAVLVSTCQSLLAIYLPIVSYTRPHKSCCQASRVPEDRKVQNPGVRRRRNCGVRTSVDCSDCSLAAAAAGGCCSVWTTWARTHSAPTRPAPSSLSAQVTGTVQPLTTHYIYLIYKHHMYDSR